MKICTANARLCRRAETVGEIGFGWFSVAIRPQKPVCLLGTGAQDGHLDFHTAPELDGEIG